MNLYIVRHGNPDYMQDKLTDLGHRQAEACAEEMLKLNIDEIYSSPMGRAIETAKHLSDKTGLDIKIENWAHEIEHYADNGGGRMGLAVQIEPGVLRSPEIERLGDKWYEHPIFNGADKAKEMVDTINQGAEDFLLRLGYKRDGNRFGIETKNEKNIALFCHAGTFVVLAGYLLRLPTLSSWQSFFMYQTGISWVNIYNYDSGYTVPRFLYINDTHHLKKSDLPLT